ncbi:chemotaxis protein CheW [Pararhodobacter sp. CCB-MM2]|uniref:chemotaxis protein CheW n=1 Tax=Pararhodobacter sp. CCB-MM2 TaxID=1786003 RepID=UPI00082C32E8|nr:chemotaxis protein CheW [Pararhodobacter sp. CCB-MM2]
MTTPSQVAALSESDLVTFRLAGDVLAVPTAALREVLEPVAVTRVPGAQPFVPGLLNVRGSIVPLVDLRIPLRMPASVIDDETRIMVLELTMDGKPGVVGIIADSVHDVTRLPPDAIEAIPPVGTRWPARFVTAIGRCDGEFVTIPNLGAILSDYLAGSESRPHSRSAFAAL